MLHQMGLEQTSLLQSELVPHKIVCSFDRVEAFAAAASEIGLIGMVIEAYPWVPNHMCFHIDKKGAYIAYEISEDSL